MNSNNPTSKNFPKKERRSTKTKKLGRLTIKKRNQNYNHTIKKKVEDEFDC